MKLFTLDRFGDVVHCYLLGEAADKFWLETEMLKTEAGIKSNIESDPRFLDAIKQLSAFTNAEPNDIGIKHCVYMDYPAVFISVAGIVILKLWGVTYLDDGRTIPVESFDKILDKPKPGRHVLSCFETMYAMANGDVNEHKRAREIHHVVRSNFGSMVIGLYQDELDEQLEWLKEWADGLKNDVALNQSNLPEEDKQNVSPRAYRLDYILEADLKKNGAKDE